MSLEASILELAKAVASLAAALPKGVAAAQTPQAAAEQEAASTVDKVVARARRTKVTEPEIDKAAAETAAKAEAKSEEKAPPPPAEKPAAEATVDVTALRDGIRAMIYKINDSKGREAALGVLRSVGKNTLKEVDDADLPKVKVAAEAALAAEADIG